MIFSAPRFVVVDDKETHLRAISETFQRIGTPCIGILYDSSQELDQNLFRGVRCLFMDLHLVGGQASTDEKRHFALIASLLEDNINKNGGPFILIVWTAHEHLSDGLREYLDSSIAPEKPYARPLAVLSLAKEKFIDVDNGDIINPETLRNSVRETILSSPQLAALLSWESDVLAAAGATLASLLSLVPSDKRKSNEFPSALDTILSQLAQEAVGKGHVDVDVRAAISMALAPILSDRILNQHVLESTRETWGKAVTRYSEEKLEAPSPCAVGEINRMLHLAALGAENFLPTDWGAVVTWPFLWTNEELRRLTGLTIDQLMKDEFRLKENTIVSPVLIRIGAACDYAQNKPGPIMYLLGLTIPHGTKINGKQTDAIWKSPLFLMPGATGVSCIHVHVRYLLTYPQDTCAAWQSCCRLREQLLMHLIITASNHAARPGIIQLRAT